MKRVLLPIILFNLSFATSLTLNQSIELIKHNSPLINLALQDIKINEQTIKKQNLEYSSFHRPRVDFNSEFQRTHQNSLHTDTLKNNLNFTYNLASYFIKPSSISSEYQNEVLKTQKDIAIASLIYDFKINYYQLIKFQYDKNQLKKDKKILTQLKMITKKLVGIGMKLPSDVLAIEDNINMIENNIMLKDEDIKLQKNRLRSQLYDNTTTDIDFKPLRIQFNHNDDRGKLDIKNSPQIKNLYYQLQSLKTQNEIINKDLYPTLYSSLEQQKDFQDSTNDQVNVIVGVNIPLFTQDTRSYDKQIQKIKLHKKTLQIAQKKAEIKAQIKEHQNKMDSDIKVYENYKKIITHKIKTSEVLLQEYKQGLSNDISSLINLQKEISDMKTQQLNFYFDYLIHSAKIKFFFQNMN